MGYNSIADNAGLSSFI